MRYEYFKSVFTGYIAGNILALIFSQWLFLEMRVNINFVIPISTLAGLVVCYYSSIRFQLKLIFTLELIFGLLLFLLYNFSFESYYVIPASMFREGFLLNSFSLGELNKVISLIFVIGNFIIIRNIKWSPYDYFKNRFKQKFTQTTT